MPYFDTYSPPRILNSIFLNRYLLFPEYFLRSNWPPPAASRPPRRNTWNHLFFVWHQSSVFCFLSAANALPHALCPILSAIPFPTSEFNHLPSDFRIPTSEFSYLSSVFRLLSSVLYLLSSVWNHIPQNPFIQRKMKRLNSTDHGWRCMKWVYHLIYIILGGINRNRASQPQRCN